MFPVMFQNREQGGFRSYEIDFTGYGDGSLPAGWTGSTFAISSAKVINTPTVGSEILTDPGLEANYTAGLCDSLTKSGAPNVAEEGVDVHGGSKAQSFEGTALNDFVRYTRKDTVAGSWYLCSQWVKRTAGTGTDFKFIISVTGGLPSGGAGYGAAIQNDTWAQKKTSFIATQAQLTGNQVVEQHPSVFHSCLMDDGSLKILTYAELFAMYGEGSHSASGKVEPATTADNTLSGLILWADSVTSPTSYLFAYYVKRAQENGLEIGLLKCVSGTYTQLINSTFAVETANAEVEIRVVNSTTVGLYYNNTQIGTNQTVNDVTGYYGGFVITGGNNIESFFLG